MADCLEVATSIAVIGLPEGGRLYLHVVQRGVDPRTPRFSGVCSAD